MWWNTQGSSYVNTGLNGLQTGLDVAGLAAQGPLEPFGVPIDLTNAAISASRGNYSDAALSASAAIPFIGIGANIAKVGERTADVANAVDVQNLIYRSASGTPASMTPRAANVNGLSAANSLDNALPGKNQVIDTSKLSNLCAVCDNLATGHVSITPIDATQMQGWINSRGATDIHPLTQELLDAVIGTVKK